MYSFLPLLRREWQLLLFGFAMSFSSCFGQTYFIALFGGEIRSDLQLSHGQFGAAYSAATLVSALLLLKTGGLIDRMDLRRFAYFAALGLAGGALLLSAAANLFLLLLALLLLRHFGQGLLSLSGATTMVRYLPRERGKANAIAGMGYSVSEAVLPSVVVAMLALTGWRESWLLWTGAIAVLLPLLVRFTLLGHDRRHARYLKELQQPEATQAARRGRPQRHWTRGEVLRDRRFYLFLPALMASPLLFTGFMFHQVQLVESKGWSLGFWGALYTLYALVSLLTKLLTGLLVDRHGAVKLVPLVILPMGLGLLLLALADSGVVALAFMLLLGITVGGYATLSSPFFAEMYGTLHLGAIKSVTTAAMVFASSIAPALMGWLIDGGVALETQALVGAGYIVAAALLASFAAGSRGEPGTPQAHSGRG